MASIHIAAKDGEIAERVLLPGDPLRAKFIAENFLEGAKLYTDIRNIFGYTGKYKGVPVSVQSTGMGIPSFMIYAYELIKEFGAKKLIRVGTCGGMDKDVKLRDVIIAQAASTDSSIIRNIFGGSVNFCPIANFDLLQKAVNNAKKLNLPVKVGNIVSVDRFYDEEIDNKKLVKYGVLAVEMEAAGLYTIAAEYHVDALAIFTVSDHIFTKEFCTPNERQTTFNDMIKIALETVIEE